MVSIENTSVVDRSEPKVAREPIDSEPLALGAFALTTFLLSAINVGWLAPSEVCG